MSGASQMRMRTKVQSENLKKPPGMSRRAWDDIIKMGLKYSI